MSQPITIIDAKQQFQDWRSNKLPGSSIPTKLWDLVNKMGVQAQNILFWGSKLFAKF